VAAPTRAPMRFKRSNRRQRGSATIDKEGDLMVCTISSERLQHRVLLPPARMRGKSKARLPQR
jgi:hypothetical protein